MSYIYNGNPPFTQVPRDQMPNHYAHAQYLLGMGPMPPSRPQDRALALFNQQANNGVFDPAQQSHPTLARSGIPYHCY